MSKWYGWIPLLTKKIFFEFFISYSAGNEEITEIVDEKEKGIIDEILPTSGSIYKYYKFFKKFDDPPKEKLMVVISVDKEYRIDNVVIFDDKWKLKWQAKCKIEDNGLVEIEMKDAHLQEISKLEPNNIEYIVTQTYITIRDIYHRHTHHDDKEKDEDILLPPVSAKDDKEAIEKINDKFQKKIITRLKRIRDMKEEDLGTSFKFITKAKGELTYALSFIELFKGSLPHHDQYYFTYLNTIRSIEILEKDIEMQYISETDKRTSEINDRILCLTNRLTFLTIWIVVVTFVIAVDASFGIIETLFHDKLFIIQLSGIWLWVSLFVLWFIVIIVLSICLLTGQRLYLVGGIFERIRKKMK